MENKKQIFKNINEKMKKIIRQYMICQVKIQTLEKIKNKHYDIVLSHTCPFDWEPTDLFLSQIDQSTVDVSTELWMNEIKDKITYNLWLFGHFHDDRLVRPHVEMYFQKIEDLEIIYNRWNGDNPSIPKDLYKDPNYNLNDNQWRIK